MTQLPRDEIENFGRVYYGDNGMEYPSVTTIISQQWDSDGEWDWWKRQNNGEGENPDYEEIREYSQSRGTLVHYTLLNPLSNDEMWGEEEQESLESLQDFGTYKYDKRETRTDAFERYQRDLQWAKKQWQLIKQDRGIDNYSAIQVENRFLHHDYPQYAGQYDLLYEDPDGDIVLADIKTSKRVYDKNKLQLTAYANACEYDIDRLEILKMHPEYEWVSCDGYKPVEVSKSTEWDTCRSELWSEFEERADETHEVMTEYTN